MAEKMAVPSVEFVIPKEQAVGSSLELPPPKLKGKRKEKFVSGLKGFAKGMEKLALGVGKDVVSTQRVFAQMRLEQLKAKEAAGVTLTPSEQMTKARLEMLIARDEMLRQKAEAKLKQIG